MDLYDNTQIIIIHLIIYCQISIHRQHVTESRGVMTSLSLRCALRYNQGDNTLLKVNIDI